MADADSLTMRMDALSAALRAAGIDPDRVAGILGSAATATMNALLLDAVVEENRRTAPAEPAADLPAIEIAEQPLRAAA